ncbi:MAG TPA: hypothetical protein VIJ83_04860, partial [Solirubrobacteraceae bacterium]
APVVFVVQTVAPVLIAPLVLHSSFVNSPLSGVPLLGCLLVVLAGAITISRSPALLALTAPAQLRRDESGSPSSPSE